LRGIADRFDPAVVELGLKVKGKGLMKQSDLYRQNAENCMQMAEAAQGEPFLQSVQENGSRMARFGRRTGLA
jgi:hypothetical protein